MEDHPGHTRWDPGVWNEPAVPSGLKGSALLWGQGHFPPAGELSLGTPDGVEGSRLPRTEGGCFAGVPDSRVLEGLSPGCLKSLHICVVSPNLRFQARARVPRVPVAPPSSEHQELRKLHTERAQGTETLGTRSETIPARWISRSPSLPLGNGGPEQPKVREARRSHERKPGRSTLWCREVSKVGGSGLAEAPGKAWAPLSPNACSKKHRSQFFCVSNQHPLMATQASFSRLGKNIITV